MVQWWILGNMVMKIHAHKWQIIFNHLRDCQLLNEERKYFGDLDIG
jgi:hypothetical protein